MTRKEIKNCVDACIACATTCTDCAISCLHEKEIKHLTKCIILDWECAAICKAAAKLMSMESAYSKELCQLCATICNACADECEKHASMGMEDCKACAEACRACAKETMGIYEKLEAQDQETKGQRWLVTEDECAIVSEVTAELISLKSAYAMQISEINEKICTAAAEDLQSHAAMEMEHCNACASVANEVHEELKKQDKAEEDFTVLNEDESQKNSKEHSAALLAASVWRSPSRHATPHSNYDVRGRRSPFANTDTFYSL
ncbi:hypothetical protein ABIB40_001730 [Pedobacter sp. UYP30]|uniref:four-helix bundle copper-binding protein n=1 Tax=Pedobacter sp. UYP30 TaxID=1756400 RepID=UPI00339B06E3